MMKYFEDMGSLDVCGMMVDPHESYFTDYPYAPAQAKVEAGYFKTGKKG